MCRLLGISYSDGEREVIPTHEIASILFYQLVKGGPHAYGWMSYNEANETVNYAKSPGRCDSPEAMQWFADEIDDDARWFVGHTRYATNGSPEDNRNNHPVWHGNVCGVHNGVLSGWEEIIEETGREDAKAEVDSEAIFAAVNKWGSVNGLKKIHGSMVTLFTTLDQPDVVQLGRTNGRSITLGWTANGNMIWASEEEALLTLEYFGITFTKISKVSENRLLLIRNGEIIHRATFRPVPKPTKVSTIAPARQGAIDWSHWDNYEWEDRDFGGVTSPSPVVPRVGVSPSALEALPDDDDDYYIAAQMLRAERRGRKLFRNNSRRNPDGSRKFVYYQGEYVTVEEYDEIMESQKK